MVQAMSKIGNAVRHRHHDLGVGIILEAKPKGGSLFYRWFWVSKPSLDLFIDSHALIVI
jgi:hypothetical protein